MTHFVIVSYFFCSEKGIGSKRWRELASLLCEQGEVTAICADGSAVADSRIRVILVPDHLNGAPVRNGFAERPHNNPIVRSLRHFVQSFLFWPDRQKWWARAAVGHIKQAWKINFRNIVISSGPRFSVHTEVCHWACTNHEPVFWVMDLRDPWTNDPAPAMRRRTPAFLTRIEARMEAKCHRRANLVTTIGANMTEMMKRDFGSSAITIYNGYPEELARLNNHSLPESPKPPIRIRYLGSIIQGIRSPTLLFDAARTLGLDAQCVRFEFWCSDPESIRQEARLCSVEQLVTCHPPVHLQESYELQATAGANLVLNGTDATANHMITGKVFELIAAKRPILAVTGPDSELRYILAECDCDGAVWDGATARRGLERLLAGQLTAPNDKEHRFSRRTAAEKLLQAIDEAVVPLVS